MKNYYAFLLLMFVGAGTGLAAPKEPISNATLAAKNVIERQITEAAVKLSTIQRQKDPFGVAVSSEVLLVAPQASKSADAPKLPTIADAVRGLTIDAVNPVEKTFQIGARVIKCGEVLTLRHRDLVFEAKVTEVTPFTVIYEDVKDGTKAAINLGIIPYLPELK